MSVLKVERKILEKNDVVAESNRRRFHAGKNTVINLVSSPGAGKTTLLEKTAGLMKDKIHISVIEGDIQTSLDAERINELGVPVVQIVTNGSCHLDAMLVRDASEQMDFSGTGIIFIENVGNLVCPAAYDLGEDFKVVVLSTTEGSDKPLKYPAMFRNSEVLIINKIDLLPYLNFSIDKMIKNALTVNPQLKVISLSCYTGEGMNEWCDFLFSLSSND